MFTFKNGPKPELYNMSCTIDVLRDVELVGLIFLSSLTNKWTMTFFFEHHSWLRGYTDIRMPYFDTIKECQNYIINTFSD